jgi:hypothetical protein
VFEEEPEIPEWSFEEVTDAAIRMALPTTSDGLLEGELGYAHRDVDIGPVHGAVSVSIIDAPQLSDFAPPTADRDLPHLRLVVEPGAGDVEAQGEIDAVFCNAAGYTSPCE